MMLKLSMWLFGLCVACLIGGIVAGLIGAAMRDYARRKVDWHPTEQTFVFTDNGLASKPKNYGVNSFSPAAFKQFKHTDGADRPNSYFLIVNPDFILEGGEGDKLGDDWAAVYTGKGMYPKMKEIDRMRGKAEVTLPPSNFQDPSGKFFWNGAEWFKTRDADPEWETLK